MFTAKISTLTDAEIAADIATLRTIVKDGSVNGMELNWDEDAEMKALLSDYEDEQYTRIADWLERDKMMNAETVSPVRRAA